MVDCAWIDDQLHCIRQEGFECSESVTDKAIIGVPERFVNREGSFRCNMNGHKPGNFSSCRFLANKGELILSSLTSFLILAFVGMVQKNS